MEEITVSCPGSCGELIQGYVNDIPYLVSCGIRLFSYVTVQPYSSKKKLVGQKARRAIKLVEDYLNIPNEYRNMLEIDIQSELSLSKGMASSTADVAATIYGIALYYGKNLTEKEIAFLCVQIEPTDSVFFNSMTEFDLKSATVAKKSFWYPHFFVLMLEPETNIETQKYHTKENETLAKEQAGLFKGVYEEYSHAVSEKNLDKLGEAATKSACLSQKILPKVHFEEILLLKENHQSIFGVNVAHSGTVIGILLKNLTEVKEIQKKVSKLDVNDFYKKSGVYQSYFEGLKQVVGEG
ncbi:MULTISPECIES: hypothetical protein [Vagococcus]|uniref:Threonine kinase in B12 biosynthesis n=1 Tax=Vagococcus fluvialis bH819 TaxID=1255619 RepID=A0A1X6WPQ9_9ENTE|nr:MULTISPECIES: hypothetical protein [Vagococcus]SLM86222.1 Threonine kinase in B12 biosynthesis [Vagococcus fluvialis bH819]HCM89686.1 hypothetical protein [Vagococcus sp.]